MNVAPCYQCTRTTSKSGSVFTKLYSVSVWKFVSKSANFLQRILIFKAKTVNPKFGEYAFVFETKSGENSQSEDALVNTDPGTCTTFVNDVINYLRMTSIATETYVTVCTLLTTSDVVRSRSHQTAIMACLRFFRVSLTQVVVIILLSLTIYQNVKK